MSAFQYDDNASSITIIWENKGLWLFDAHEITHYTVKEPTCTKDGNIEYWECTVCGDKFTNENGENAVDDVMTALKGHNLTHVKYIVPTDTENGVKEHWICENFGKKFLDEAARTEITDIVIPAERSNETEESGSTEGSSTEESDRMEESSEIEESSETEGSSSTEESNPENSERTNLKSVKSTITKQSSYLLRR